MQSIDEVVDVEDATPNIKNFQDESEERDAAKHHVREVVDDRADEQLCLASMFSYLFFGAGFYPFLKRSLRVARLEKGGFVCAILRTNL